MFAIVGVAFVDCYNIDLVVVLCCSLVSYLAMLCVRSELRVFVCCVGGFWCGCFGCGWVNVVWFRLLS